MVSAGVHGTPDSFTDCFMRAHKHLDAGVTLLRETHPGHANEMASYVNKMYALLIEVQDDTEPVFTGSDLIAYDTTKGLAKASGFSSLGFIDCLTPSLPKQPNDLSPTTAVTTTNDDKREHFMDVMDLPEQRPPLMRLFGPNSHVVQAASTDSSHATLPSPGFPASQSWASVTSKSSEIVEASPTVPSDPPQTSGGAEVVSSSLSPKTEITHQMRVVWVRNCPPHAKLADISKLIRGGPVKSITFNNDPRTTTSRAVRIVFYLARDAAQFLDVAQAQTLTGNTWVKGLQFNAGKPFPEDMELRMMDPPLGARRRLTIVRAGLFGSPSTKSTFHQEIYNVVRRTAVELIFFYNSGNATVVLDSVVNAIKLKSHFDIKANIRDSLFNGVQATFSKDPCEHVMRLVSGTNFERQQRLSRAKNEGGVGGGNKTARKGVN